MSLPISNKQVSSTSSPAQNQLLRAGAPVTFNILKERLKANGSGAGGNCKESQNQSPFVSTSHGHPGFHPQKLGKGTSSEARTPKLPKPPERPFMPYMRYSRKVWDQVKAQNPELKLWEIGKIIGQMWRDLPTDNKAEFIEEYEAEKVEYEKNLKQYYNSPAYLAYMSTKSKGKSAQQSADDRETHDRSSGGSKQDRRIEIQPAEDDDDADEVHSAKDVSHARYARNHRLINEIFSDTVVPDVRSVVTTSRMQSFRWKIQSLEAHQKKRESEVEQLAEKFEATKRKITEGSEAIQDDIRKKQMELEVEQLVEKFEATKRKFNEGSEAFQDDIKKFSKQAVDEECFNKMVEKECEKLRKERSANINSSVDELKKDVGRDSPHDSLHSACDLISTDPPSTADAEQSSSGKTDTSMSKVSEEGTCCITSVTAFEDTVATVQSGYHQANVNPNPALPSGSYNYYSPQAAVNQMLPPALQPTFMQRPFSANARPKYSYTVGFPPQYNTHQLPQSYYPPSYPFQTQGLSMPRPTVPFGPSLDTQTDIPSDDDDPFGAISSD